MIKKNENYKYICDKKFSNQSLDYENNDFIGTTILMLNQKMKCK